MTTSPDTGRAVAAWWRLPARASALAVTAAVLAVCSGDEPPSELPMPKVTWPDSAMVYELEDSPWVQMVREAEVLSSVAWNNLDYSDPDLIAGWGYDTVVEELYDDAELRLVPAAYDTEHQGRSLLDWGPNPLVVLDVVDVGDSGVVKACAVAGRSLGSGDIWGVVVRDYFVRDVGAGRTEISYEDSADSPSDLGFGECTADAMPEVVFDPAPEFPPSSDVALRPPAERKVYEEMRASDG